MEPYTYLIGQAEPAPDGAAAPQQPGPPPMAQFLPFILIFFVIYFVVLRPQGREREALAKQLNKLEKNDRVLTSGGVYGYVVSVKEGEDEMVIKTGDQEPATRLTISKTAVVRIFRANESAEKKA